MGHTAFLAIKDIDIDIEDLFTVEYYKPITISSVALFLRQTYVKQQIITEHAI